MLWFDPLRWTSEEVAYLGRLPDREVARLIGRRPGDVTAKRRHIGVCYFAQKRRCWTPKEDRLLGTAQDHVIAQKINRSASAVCWRRAQLGIAPA